MSQITLQTHQDLPSQQSTNISSVLNNNLDSELFPPAFQEKIQQLVSLSKVSASEARIETNPVFRTQGFVSQQACLHLGSKNVCLFSMIGKMDSKGAVDIFTQATDAYMAYIKEKKGYALSFAVLTDVAVASLVQVNGIHLLETDKESSIASRTVVMIQGGILANIAKFLTENAASHGSPHHQLVVRDNPTDSFEWLFTGIEKELGLVSE